MSDGECDEGTTWESALIANQFEVGNLVAIIDRNRLQSFGDTEKTLSLEPFKSKWESFGWNVSEVDGHDHEAMKEIISNIRKSLSSMPNVIIANTIKGKGISFMENQVVWHYRPPSDEQLAAALLELEAQS
jgi:transketolase